MIETLKRGGTFVLDSAGSADLDELMPRSMRCFLAEKRAKIFRIDASAVAKKLGMPGRINMIIQTVFFGLSVVLPTNACINLL